MNRPAEPGTPHLIHRVIARLNVGGPAMHVVNLADALDEGRWRTRLIAGEIEASEGDMRYYAEERGVDVTLLPAMARSIRPLRDLKTLLRLYRTFRTERPQVVHTHTAKAGTLGRLAAVLAGVPVRIHTYHGHVLGGDYFPGWKTRLFLEIERQLGRLTQRLVVLTEGQANELAEELRVAPRERFAVVPLGLDLDRFVAIDRGGEKAEARARLGIPEGAYVLGIVGRMVPIKNHELFFRVLREVANRIGGDVVAVVVGAGERQEALESYVDDLGVGDRVQWLGWRSDVDRLYPAMDALLLTSHDEGTPVAVIEALASGLPVFARAVGGVPELLARAGAGVPVPIEAEEAEWARIIDTADPTPLDADARVRVARDFSVERLAADLSALYLAEIG